MNICSETDYKIVMRPPGECSVDEREEFKKLIEKGGQVSASELAEIIEKAQYLAWVEVGSGMVGVAALKNPRECYRDRSFTNAESKEQPSKWETELGWILVKCEHREKGLASRLICRLLTEGTSDGVYATARENNKAIARLLPEFGFVKSGVPYPSNGNGYNLVLYVKTGETNDQRNDN